MITKQLKLGQLCTRNKHIFQCRKCKLDFKNSCSVDHRCNIKCFKCSIANKHPIGKCIWIDLGPKPYNLSIEESCEVCFGYTRYPKLIK